MQFRLANLSLAFLHLMNTKEKRFFIPVEREPYLMNISHLEVRSLEVRHIAGPITQGQAL